MVDWRQAVDGKWGGLRFGDLRVESKADQHVFEVEILLNGLDPNAVRVELYADGINGGGAAERVEMKLLRALADGAGGGVYGATVSSTRPASDYTPRVIPQRSGVAVPLESTRILWQR
jgi:starch phosphorylase